MLQTPEQPQYSGTDLLWQIEDLLQNYNRWIIRNMLESMCIKIRTFRALDFGAGIGSLSAIFEAMTGIRPDAVDVDPNLAEIMRSRGYKTYESIDSVEGTYDVIFTSNVLEHIPDDEDTLRSLQQKLRDDGMLAIYVPAFDTLWTSVDDSVGHCRRYTKEGLATKLCRNGFRVSSIRYCDSVGFFLTLLFKLFGGGQKEPPAYALRFFDRYLVTITQRLDLLTHLFFGKNVLAIAQRDPAWVFRSAESPLVTEA